MNVPYGNPHGPIVDCCTLHFSIPYTHVFSDCINLYSALLYLFILLLSDDGNGFPETL